jgi:hypothetical protein
MKHGYDILQRQSGTTPTKGVPMNGDKDENDNSAEEAQKEALRQEREQDPEAFDEKYGTDQGEQPSGDPHKN